MEMILGYIAGLLTLINPCVLTVFPIVLASAVQAGRHGPLATAAGMCVTFVTFGMLVATVSHSIGLTEELLACNGAFLMMVFGTILPAPRFNESIATAAASRSSEADARMSSMPSTSMRSHCLGGVLLGAIWSPCIGPTFGGAISLASQGQDLAWAFMIMLSFGLGISSVIIVLRYGTGEAIRRRQVQMRGIAAKAKPVMGAAFLLVGQMILLKVHHLIKGWLVGSDAV